MRALAVIAILAALALGGWNYWQINQLRAETTAPDTSKETSVTVKHAGEALDLIERSRDSVAQASTQFEAGNKRLAQASLEAALRDLDAATELLKDDPEKRGVLDSIRGAISDRLSKEATDAIDGKKASKKSADK